MLPPICDLLLAGVSAYLLLRSWRESVLRAELESDLCEATNNIRLIRQYGIKR